jgi:hypothetical protein
MEALMSALLERGFDLSPFEIGKVGLAGGGHGIC